MMAQVPVINEVSQYDGRSTARVSATQLGSRYTAAQARRVLAEWIDFFAAGPTPVRDLRFVSKTPKRLFAALSGQTQLKHLHVKWGDYDDLTALTRLTDLRMLTLGGASAVHSIEPLAALRQLTSLEIDYLLRVHDLSALAGLTQLRSLVVGGNWASFKNAHFDSLAFLRSMPQLQNLVLHTAVVDDGDYSPLLALPALQSIRVKAVPGMTPAIDQLKAALPWSG